MIKCYHCGQIITFANGDSDVAYVVIQRSTRYGEVTSLKFHERCFTDAAGEEYIKALQVKKQVQEIPVQPFGNEPQDLKPCCECGSLFPAKFGTSMCHGCIVRKQKLKNRRKELAKKWTKAQKTPNKMLLK